MTHPIMPPDLRRVRVCAPDHYGRLTGHEICASRLDAVSASGLELTGTELSFGPASLPAADLPEPGRDDPALGGGVLWPDMETFRRLPWDPANGIVIAHERRPDGTPLAEAPRTILQQQADRLARHGLHAQVASELEFYVFEDSYPQAFSKAYRRLHPLRHRDRRDHLNRKVRGMLTDVLDFYLRPLREIMSDLGLPTEGAHGAGGPGHAQVSFPASEPRRAADSHALFKYAAKALAEEQSRAVTFMAKPDQLQAGSSCRFQIALRDADGNPCTAACADPGGTELSEQARQFLSGVVNYTPELVLLHAPLVNSYRRLQPSGSARSAPVWGNDNPDAMVRIIGGGPSLRMEFRLPGADVNPYLSIAALLAAGLAGLTDGATGPAAAVEPFGPLPSPVVPLDLTEAVRRFEQSPLPAAVFGAQAAGHITAMARHQLRMSRCAVTDWELEHGFETA
jgi:glutamine synthetase